MRQFKLTHILAFTLSLSFLNACTLPSPGQRAGAKGSATFDIASSDGKYLETDYADSSVPKSKSFSFKACLIDIKYEKPILNQNFNLIDDQGNKKPLLTDNDGCVNWSEKVNYNTFTKGKFVEVKRTLQATGLHKGTQDLSFALNPWEDLIYSLKSVKIPDLVSADKAQAALSDDQKGILLLDDVRVQIDEKNISSLGTNLYVQMRANLSYKMVNSSNEEKYIPILNGNFSADIYLISQTSDTQKVVDELAVDNRHLLAKKIDAKTFFENGNMYINALLTLNQYCTRGQYRIGIRLKPNSNSGFATFESLYYANESDNIKGSGFGRRTNDAAMAGNNFKLANYVNLDRIAADDDSCQVSGIKLSKAISIVADKVLITNSYHRTKNFNVTACLMDSLDQKNIRSQNFTVTKINGQKDIEKTLDNNGCLVWPDSVSYNYLETEREIDYTIKIKNENLGVDSSFAIRINPWADNDGAFYKDLSFNKTLAKTKPMQVNPSLKSEIQNSSYSYSISSGGEDQGIHPTIDNLLNLKISRDIILSLGTLMIKRPSMLYSVGYFMDYLPEGDYLLKWAILDPRVKNYDQIGINKILQVDQKIVHLNAMGVIPDGQQPHFDISSFQIEAVGNRNQVLFELLPVKASAQVEALKDPKADLSAVDLNSLVEPGNLKISTLKGSFMFTTTTNSQNLTTIENGGVSIIDKIIAQNKVQTAERLNAQSAASTKEAVASAGHLTLINLTQKAYANWLSQGLKKYIYDYVPGIFGGKNSVSPETLQQWIDSGKMPRAVSSGLCYFWFGPYTDNFAKNFNGGKSVLVQPENLSSICDVDKYFDIQYRYFIKQVDPTPKAIHTLYSTLGASRSFSLSYSYSRGFSGGIGGGLELEAGGKLPLGPLKAGGGIKMSGSYSESESHSKTNTEAFSNSVSPTFENLNVTFTALEYEKCAVIKIKPSVYTKAQGPDTEGSFHLFSDGASPLLFTSSMSEQNQAAYLKGGLMVCPGTTTQMPKDITESYYVINQHGSDSEVSLTDNYSRTSRPLFAFVRGKYDLAALLSATTLHFTDPDTSKTAFILDKVTQGDMKNLFLLDLPAYPGQYIER